MKIEQTCSICGETFFIESNNYKTIEAAKQTLSKIVKKHIKNVHNISIEDYCIKTYYNNIRPVCACGCGKKLDFYEKNCFYTERHGFNKYYHCSHVSKTPEFASKLANYSYVSKYNDLEWLKKHYDELYGWDIIMAALNDFLNNDDYTKTDICKKYNVDCRTLKKIWLKFNLITEEEFKNRTTYNRYKLASKHRRKIFDNYEDICNKLYVILKTNPLVYNISSLIRYFNDTNLIQINCEYSIVLQKLYELYGDEINEYLQYGYHSKEELSFINILKYYFGKKNIIVGKKIQYCDTNKKSYIYDCCINNKIIIEYDGSGFYHQNIIKDIKKENFAINSGYIMYRVSDKSAKDPNTILNIKKLLNYD